MSYFLSLTAEGVLNRTVQVDASRATHVYVNNLLAEKIYYAEYTSVNINSIPGRPGRAISFGVSVGF
jgi:hypothetical protein